VVEAHQLAVDLSVLTGESQPVARDTTPQSSTSLRAAERSNLLLAGSTVASGHGEGLVFATGSETEFGQVAHLTANTARAISTLEVQIERIVHTISVIALSTGLVAFTISVLVERMDPLQSLIYAVGIIVGFVPEGLLPQVTLTLALNVQRMARRQALVRRLSAVETLGSVSVICSDKTGTITQNRMAVEDTWLPHGDSTPVSAAPGRRPLLQRATDPGQGCGGTLAGQWRSHRNGPVAGRRSGGAAQPDDRSRAPARSPLRFAPTPHDCGDRRDAGIGSLTHAWAGPAAMGHHQGGSAGGAAALQQPAQQRRAGPSLTRRTTGGDSGQRCPCRPRIPGDWRGSAQR
jgi:magnesium-transporting ATPase (P-type)